MVNDQFPLYTCMVNASIHVDKLMRLTSVSCRNVVIFGGLYYELIQGPWGCVVATLIGCTSI